jgi:hypothetical protein
MNWLQSGILRQHIFTKSGRHLLGRCRVDIHFLVFVKKVEIKGEEEYIKRKKCCDLTNAAFHTTGLLVLKYWIGNCYITAAIAQLNYLPIQVFQNTNTCIFQILAQILCETGKFTIETCKKITPAITPGLH